MSEPPDYGTTGSLLRVRVGERACPRSLGAKPCVPENQRGHEVRQFGLHQFDSSTRSYIGERRQTTSFPVAVPPSAIGWTLNSPGTRWPIRADMDTRHRRVENHGARRLEGRCAGANPPSGHRSALLLRAICKCCVLKRSGSAMKDDDTSILSAIEQGSSSMTRAGCSAKESP
jgi:hypothetical protein